MRPLFRGPWNRALGWALLAAGFAGAIWLDPWSLGQRDPSALIGSPRMAARHAQAVVLGMAFLQIIVGELLGTALFPDWAERAASWLTGSGALLYSFGYALLGHW